MNPARHILWVDDEIEFLRPHQIFLERKGYRISTAGNGDDAIALVIKNHYDLVLLDEMMPGKDGLTTLNEIKNKRPNLPIVMVTKSEAEDLLDQAIGQRIDGYLLKPVQPLQVLSICRQILDQQAIREKQVTPEYVQQLRELSARIEEGLEWPGWIEIYLQLIHWELELEATRAEGLQTTHNDLRQEANRAFAAYIRRVYPDWLAGKNPPLLCPQILRSRVQPLIRSGRPVFFIVIDCLRIDQWQVMAPYLNDLFAIQTDYAFSILPTATPYARNALFAGLFPDDIARLHPEYWQERSDDETSRNQFEAELLKKQVQRLRLVDPERVRYQKISTHDEMVTLRKKLDGWLNCELAAVVVNFLDILTHGRSESSILRELATDERAFRALAAAWFQHSALLDLLRDLAAANIPVVITSDHGAILCRRATKVIGDRETSTNLRYKFGHNLQCDEKCAVRLTKPKTYRLPEDGLNKNYLIAAEDYYFVYPTHYHHYQRQYADSFQHGGISLEEMIVPVITLMPLPPEKGL